MGAPTAHRSSKASRTACPAPHAERELMARFRAIFPARARARRTCADYSRGSCSIRRSPYGGSRAVRGAEANTIIRQRRPSAIDIRMVQEPEDRKASTSASSTHPAARGFESSKGRMRPSLITCAIARCACRIRRLRPGQTPADLPICREWWRRSSGLTGTEAVVTRRREAARRSGPSTDIPAPPTYGSVANANTASTAHDTRPTTSSRAIKQTAGLLCDLG